MKKVLKYLIISLVVFVGLIALAIKIKSQPQPKGTITGADDFARNIEQSLNKPAFDSLKFLSFTYTGRHTFIWDKQGNRAIVRWGEDEVHLDLDKVDGKAYCKGKEVFDKQKTKLIQSAWSYWCNDSYWMFAPYKLFDKGTSRSLVKNDDGTDHLMITYASGGVTPGDSYLWKVDENYLPTQFRMWVKIIPLKGMPATWEDWMTLPCGAKLSQSHKIAFYTARATDIKEGQDWEDFGFEDTPAF